MWAMRVTDGKRAKWATVLDVRPRLVLRSVVLGAPDASALAAFYERLLGWPRIDDQPGWVKLRSHDGGTAIAFQTEADYVAPTWPAEPGTQQMTAPLDIATDDLAAAVAWADENGASAASYQPQDDVRVMLDPAGHPFCLFEIPT